MTRTRSRRGRAVVLFDLDNTLVSRRDAFRRWVGGVLDRAGIDEPEAVEQLVRWDADGYGDKATWFTQAQEQLGGGLTAERLWSEHSLHFASCFRLDVAVRAGLQELRSAGAALGIVTNGPPSQRRKIAAVGLDDLVDAVVVSGEVGVAKPHPLIFSRAAEQLGCEVGGGWMVGDRREFDIAGGAAVGMRTAWVRLPGTTDAEEGTEVTPDLVVDDIAEVFDHLLP